MSDNWLNKQGAKYLAEQYQIEIISEFSAHFINNKINRLIIMDIAGDAHLTSLKLEEELADELIRMGLPESCTDIYFLMSDIDPKKSLILFANILSTIFMKKHKRKIQIHVPSHIAYDVTLLLSTTIGHWAIYGLQKENIIKELENYIEDVDYLTKISNKKLLWEGKDILNYLENSRHTFTGISYAWE